MHPPSVSIVRLVQRGSPSVIKLSSEATTKGTYPGRLFFTQQMVHPPTPPHFLPPTLATTLADCMKVNDFKPEFFYTHVEVRLPQFIENLRIVDALKTRIIVHEEENDKRNNNQWIIPNDGEPELREPSSESLDNDRFPVEQHQDQTPVGLLCRTNWRETKKRTGKSKNPKPKYCHRKAKRLNHLRFVFALEDVDYEGLRSAKRGVIPFKSSHVLQKMKFATFKDENPEIATRLEDPNGYRRRQQNKG